MTEPSTENSERVLMAVVSREEGAGISPYTALNLTVLNGAHNVDLHITVCPHDLVRARSRCHAVALEGGYAGLLFWDGDVSLKEPVLAVQHMIMLTDGIVHTLYPRKSKERSWPIVRLGEQRIQHPDHSHLFEIAMCGMGCTYITRSVLQKVWDATPAFYDEWGGVTREPHATFMLMQIGKELLPEDYSFCYRARELGCRVWCNAADVADHFGATLFEGAKP
jgi:hypothetical protein